MIQVNAADCFSATDDFNHGVVLSSRPLRSNEVFQVRIDKMVDKWAGSIEIGVTTHNPAYLQLPSTMTNLRSGERPRCLFLKQVGSASRRLIF